MSVQRDRMGGYTYRHVQDCEGSSALPTNPINVTVKGRRPFLPDRLAGRVKIASKGYCK